jgi:hypothetical protein
MSPKKNSHLTAAELIALRGHIDALKAITEKLGVKEMGPADHIRTKHEVKAFLQASGDMKEAEAIVTRARARRDLWETQSVAQNLTQRQQRGQQLND